MTYVYALAIDPTTPSTLYAGTGSDGVFKSTDGGGSWSAVNTGLPGTAVVVDALAIDPDHARHALRRDAAAAASSRAPTAAAAGAPSTRA